jgi:hypothetical protein
MSTTRSSHRLPTFLPTFARTGRASASDPSPDLSLRDRREPLEAADSKDLLPLVQSSEPQLEAQPGTMLKTLAAGAGVGMIAARLIYPNFDAMMLGAIGGAGAAGMSYAIGVGTLACYRRESSAPPQTPRIEDYANNPEAGPTIATGESPKLRKGSAVTALDIHHSIRVPVPKSRPRKQSGSDPRIPILEARTDRLAYGAIACGALTGIAASVAMPIASTLVNNPIARILLFTVPTVVPMLGAVCLGYTAIQQNNVVEALRAAENKAARLTADEGIEALESSDEKVEVSSSTDSSSDSSSDGTRYSTSGSAGDGSSRSSTISDVNDNDIGNRV